MQTVRIGDVSIGPQSPLAVLAGPCVAESREVCLRIGAAVRDRCAALGLGYLFKASFDKANRSSIASYRGPGLEDGLELLARVKRELGVPVVTDIHLPEQAAPAAEVADVLQIPAFLCRQTDLLAAAARTGRAVNVKKGQFLSPGEMTNVVTKLEEAAKLPGAGKGKKKRRPSPQPSPSEGRGGRSGGIILTERGTFFGYHRLVNDFAGLGDLMELGWPVCFDVTHSTQQPGGQGHQSGGRPERAALLARAAVAAGVQALFLETHPDPARAQSDATTMLPLEQTLTLLGQVAELHRLARTW